MFPILFLNALKSFIQLFPLPLTPLQISGLVKVLFLYINVNFKTLTCLSLSPSDVYIFANSTHSQTADF